MFFRCNKFISKVYDDRYFDEIVDMCFYAKATPDSPLQLINNKRPSAVILLKGTVAIHKKESEIKKKGKKKIQ